MTFRGLWDLQGSDEGAGAPAAEGIILTVDSDRGPTEGDNGEGRSRKV